MDVQVKDTWKKRKSDYNDQDRAGENQRYPTRKSADFQPMSAANSRHWIVGVR